MGVRVLQIDIHEINQYICKVVPNIQNKIKNHVPNFASQQSMSLLHKQVNIKYITLMQGMIRHFLFLCSFFTVSVAHLGKE